MKILYAAMKYDFGFEERGYSFEHYNFFDTLRHMGHDILYFDFRTLLRTLGPEQMNQRLREVVRTEKPHLLFSVIQDNKDLDPVVVREISQSETRTFNWFCDDHWRFDSFSRFWAPCFNGVSTTAGAILPRYRRAGLTNVLKTQWAANPFLYRKLDLPLAHSVTFIGQNHGNRAAVLQRLRDKGCAVEVWGTGWEAGRLSQEDMIRMFNQSRVNINFSLSPGEPPSLTGAVSQVSQHSMASLLRKLPGGRGLLTPLYRLRDSWRAYWLSLNAGTLQIKGRNFEIPGCGGFLLTGHAENLEDYFELGKEVVCYSELGDLIEKVRYFLVHDRERQDIADSGYARVLREHTYVHRFSEIFRFLHLPSEDPNTLLAHPPSPGRLQEIV